MNSSVESPIFAELRELLAERIVFMDGAMGTMVQTYDLEEGDFRGEEFSRSEIDLIGNNKIFKYIL